MLLDPTPPCIFRYTSAAGFQPILGDNSLPIDYYTIGTTHYIPRWFSDVSRFDGSELPQLYAETAKFFDKS